MPQGIRRAAAMAALLAVPLAAPAAQAAAAVCPDPATVQAARVVEFQTMMMGVSVRCKHVGVGISDHLDEMNGARRTMLSEANDRVALFLRSLNTKSASGAAIPALSPPPASAPKAAAGKDAAGKATSAKPGLAKAAPAKDGLAKAAPANPGMAKQGAAKPRTPAAAPAPAKPAAKVSRRTDPFDRYLTMIGNQYGGGMTTLQRCKAFDAIVMSLSDKTNSDRLLTMISSSLVQVTLLEAIVNCPPGKQ